MEFELQIDVSEARELLEQSVRIKNTLTKRINCFEEGIEILNDSLTEKTNSPAKVIVNSIKETYFRKFIENLDTIYEIEPEIWLEYFSLILKFPNEFLDILKRYPDLKEIIKSFISIYCAEVNQNESHSSTSSDQVGEKSLFFNRKIL